MKSQWDKNCHSEQKHNRKLLLLLHANSLEYCLSVGVQITRALQSNCVYGSEIDVEFVYDPILK